MKVYVDFKDLDAEDMPSNISNKYDLQVRSINGGSEYRSIEVQSLSDYTQQVRKEVCEEIKAKAIKNYTLEHKIYTYCIEPNVLDQIQGE